MKTIVIHDSCGERPLKFFIVDGDKTHLHGVYVGQAGVAEEAEEEVISIIENTESFDAFPIIAVDSDTVVITVGFIP